MFIIIIIWWLGEKALLWSIERFEKDQNSLTIESSVDIKGKTSCLLLLLYEFQSKIL